MTNSVFNSMFTTVAAALLGGVAAIGVGTSLARHNVGDTHKSACQAQQAQYEAALGADAKIIGECR